MQLGHPGAGDRRAAHDRGEVAAPYSSPKGTPHGSRVDGAPVHPARQQPVVGLGDGGYDGLGGERHRGHSCLPAALVGDPCQRDGGRRQPATHLVEDSPDVGARPVDLVDEQHASARRSGAERARSPPICGWTPSTEDSTSTAASRTTRERSTSAMKSGWPGGVEEVDVEVAERERGDGGADRDSAPALERHRVGARGAGVDAAGRVELTRLVQQAFGQAGLAGVNVRDDSEVESMGTRGSSTARRMGFRGVEAARIVPPG